jgi:hypothetical protein
MMTNGWNPQRRRLPWEKSTGPRTAGGKTTVAQNGYKGGPARETLRALGRALKQLEADSAHLARYSQR